jgi:hypothetical protein
LSENKIGPQASFKRETIVNPWTGEDEFMHSSRESIFFRSCINRQYEVTKNHGITIPYQHQDGTMRNYIPDFFGREDKALYEMKGRHDAVDQTKWAAAKAFCEKRNWWFVMMLASEEA